MAQSLCLDLKAQHPDSSLYMLAPAWSAAVVDRMPEVDGVAVVFAKAEGEKCARCWKVLPDVGSHATPGVCGRCDEAVRG